MSNKQKTVVAKRESKKFK